MRTFLFIFSIFILIVFFGCSGKTEMKITNCKQIKNGIEVNMSPVKSVIGYIYRPKLSDVFLAGELTSDSLVGVRLFIKDENEKTSLIMIGPSENHNTLGGSMGETFGDIEKIIEKNILVSNGHNVVAEIVGKSGEKAYLLLSFNMPNDETIKAIRSKLSIK